MVDTYKNMTTMCYTLVSTTKHKKKKVGIVYRATSSSYFSGVATFSLGHSLYSLSSDAVARGRAILCVIKDTQGDKGQTEDPKEQIQYFG